MTIATRVLALSYWSSETQITNSPNTVDVADVVITPNGTQHLLFLDNRTGMQALYYQRKPDADHNWSMHTVLSNETGGIQAGSACLCSDTSNNIYAVWEEYYGGNIQLYFSRSLDDGNTWSNPVVVAGSVTSVVRAKSPAITVDNMNTLHLIWQDEETSQIKYRKGPADGLNLSTPMVLNSFSASHPGIAFGSARLLAYWQESIGGYEQIKYRESADLGETWNNNYFLSNASTDDCEAPYVTFCNDDFYALWQQANGTAVMLRIGKADVGLLSELTISTSTGICSEPVLAVFGSKMIAAWVYNDAGNYRIRFNMSLDQGVSWGEDSGFSYGTSVSSPRLAADRGNFNIYYSYAAAGTATQIFHALRDDIDPAAPVITCQSNVGAKSSGNNYPEFSWVSRDNEGGIGIAGFALLLDTQASTDPGSTVQKASNVTSISYSNLANGKYYFHIRAIDLLGNPGHVSHYALDINRNSFCPEQEVWVAPSPVRDGRFNLRYFLSKPAEIKLEFYDAAGRKISLQNYSGLTGINRLQLDIGDWVNGTYFFRLTARELVTGQEAVITKAFAVLR
ncbi:hypothetical protein KAR34_10095 [bacterium]|nr:hypothetical protein [bacterium]